MVLCLMSQYRDLAPSRCGKNTRYLHFKMTGERPIKAVGKREGEYSILKSHLLTTNWPLLTSVLLGLTENCLMWPRSFGSMILTIRSWLSLSDKQMLRASYLLTHPPSTHIFVVVLHLPPWLLDHVDLITSDIFKTNGNVKLGVLWKGKDREHEFDWLD